MRVLRGEWRSWAADPRATALTVGVLDGVHAGHRRLLEHVTADGLVPTVVTFDPHPVEVLSPGTTPRLITTIDERIDLLAATGITQVAVLDLSEVRDLPAHQFVSDLLLGKLSARKIVAGGDFRFGKDREGDVTLLRVMSGEGGFALDVVEMVEANGTISSSRIRGLLEAHEVREAARLMGWRYRLTGTVIDGDKRGREIGYPTANLTPPPRKVIPGDGVYAAYAHVEGVKHKAAVNIGVRPTFGGGTRLVEAFLLDYEGDLYSRPMTIEFVDYLRPELRFESVDELVGRMRQDVAETRAMLGSPPGI